MRLIEYLFPCQCVLCSKVGDCICLKCIKKLPHTLPTCCVCNRLSNKYLTHSSCSNINITYYTGWYLSKEVNNTLMQKIQKGNWNTHIYLLTTLISYLKIENIIKGSRIYPLPSKNKNISKLNRILSKSIKGRKKDNNILFVGERLENIQEVNKLLSELQFNPLNIYILCIFVVN